MSKPVKLTPVKNSNGVWVLSIPDSLSSTGKRRREFFQKREAADARVKELKTLLEAGARVARVAGPELIRTAVNFDELFRDVYGFEGGLAGGCEYLIKLLDERNRSVSFRELLVSHERSRSGNWGKQYQTTWNTFRKFVKPLEPRPVIGMGAEFWREWLETITAKEGWSDRTFNDYASLLSSVWKHGVAQELCEKNPIDGVVRRKIRRIEKAVYTVEQVTKLLNTAWKFDRDLVPFFALTIFAGVRPDLNGEIGQLTWEDVNFEEKWIRVGANFDNKTNTKRFVPMESNLQLWLAPWRSATGKILPINFVKRRRYLTRGKYQAPSDAAEDTWPELVPYGLHVRDITRHTYGSYLEARYRDRNVVKENMGHTDFETYEQHYRNARSPQEAEAFWSIVPSAES